MPRAKKETAEAATVRPTIDKAALHKQLADKFDALDVMQRDGAGRKLDYVPINKFIERMNTQFPLGYSWQMDTPIITEKNVFIKGRLTIQLDDGSYVIREGVGADRLGSDPDKSIKTAQAEAFKKACHTLGVSLYLWDEKERNELARERVQAARDIQGGRSFTSEQIESMKKIKAEAGGDEGLVELISKWSNGKIKDPRRLNVNNINDFIKYADENKVTA